MNIWREVALLEKGETPRQRFFSNVKSMGLGLSHRLGHEDQIPEGGLMEDHLLEEVLRKYRTVAVVGLSPKEDRPSYRVARYLKENGYRIIPVNPSFDEILGEKAYSSLMEIPAEIDIEVVEVFRKPEEVPPIAQQAVERGARVLWLQEGIVNEEAASKAREAGLTVVQDRCMLKEHRRLLAKDK